MTDRNKENPEAEAERQGKVTESLGGGNVGSGLGAELGPGGTLTEDAGASRDVTIGGAIGDGFDGTLNEPPDAPGAASEEATILLRGLDFPASREQILEYASENGAPPEVIDRLERIPDRDYYKLIDIIPFLGDSGAQ